VPGCINVKLNVPPEGVIIFDARVVPVSLVTVCGASEALVQTTLVPFATVRVAGPNPYLSFCSEIFTLATAELAAVVPAGAAVAVGAVVAVAVVLALVLVPHPARNRIPTSMTQYHHRILSAFEGNRMFIVFLLSCVGSFS
jgi:hypothetical protein